MTGNSITLTVIDGPVEILSLNQDGVSERYPLWNGIVGYEAFPANMKSANYVLKLEKAVERHQQCSLIETELKEALQSLAEPWLFAGGTVLRLNKSIRSENSRVQSNVEEIERLLLNNEGLLSVSQDIPMRWAVTGCYANPPLRKAIEIASFNRVNPDMRKVLHNFYKAQLYDKDWYCSLYKVKDMLVIVFGSSSNARKIVDAEKQWGIFEKILNNYDLRHPGRSDKIYPVSKENKAIAFSIARI